MANTNAVGNTLTGVTGSGTFVGATSPTLVTPALGTPSSGNLANCTGYPGASSDWVLISTGTASSSATIDFTGLSSTYFVYKIFIENLVPGTTSTDLYLRTSTNNGSSYDSAASDYEYYSSYSTSNGPASAIISSTGATFIDIMTSLTTGSGGLDGEITIYNPSSVSECRINYSCKARLGANNYIVTGGGVRNTAADVNAIRFLMSSGNIGSGIFKLYGLKA